VGGEWWVYFCGADPDIGNSSHRMYVLHGPSYSQNPLDETSVFKYEGPVRDMPNQWAIDGTVFTIENTRYMVYSGWPVGKFDSELKQELYIVRMADPMSADSSGGVHLISTPQYGWERWRESITSPWHDIDEGPEWLELDPFKGIIFSAGASWTSNYNLGILQYTGGDPLSASSWVKYKQTLLCNNGTGRGPYAPGHCSYISPATFTDTGLCHRWITPRCGLFTTPRQAKTTAGRTAKHIVSRWRYVMESRLRDYILYPWMIILSRVDIPSRRADKSSHHHPLRRTRMPRYGVWVRCSW
jgi:GH43 family beta-xylosidase